MLCLDTTFIIDLLKNRLDALSKFKQIKGEELHTTIINIYEIKAGIQRKFESHIVLRETAIFNKLLSSIRVIGLDIKSVGKAAEINGKLTKEGAIIDDLDILITAICLANGCNTIITKNKKHFSRIKGLKVETY